MRFGAGARSPSDGFEGRWARVPGGLPWELARNEAEVSLPLAKPSVGSPRLDEVVMLLTRCRGSPEICRPAASGP
jgi:hypothetical protein